MLTRAKMLVQMGKGIEAEPVLRECLAKQRRALGEGHLDTLSSMSTLGELLLDNGQTAEAETLLRESLSRRRSGYGGLPPRTVVGETKNGQLFVGHILYQALNSLGLLFTKKGDHRQALLLLEEAAELQRELDGGISPEMHANLAHIRRCTGGSRDAALADFEAVHAQLRGTLGRSHPKTLAAAMNIGVLLLKGKQHERALVHHRQYAALARQHLGRGSETTRTLICGHAKALQALGRVDDALPLFEEELLGRLEAHDAFRLDAGMDLVKLLRDHGRPGKADEIVRMCATHGVDLIGVGHDSDSDSVDDEEFMRQMMSGERMKSWGMGSMDQSERSDVMQKMQGMAGASGRQNDPVHQMVMNMMNQPR